MDEQFGTPYPVDGGVVYPPLSDSQWGWFVADGRDFALGEWHDITRDRAAMGLPSIAVTSPRY